MAPIGVEPTEREGLRKPCLGGVFALVAGIALAATAGDREADGHFEKRTSSHFVLYQDVGFDEAFGLRGARRFETRVLEHLEEAYGRLDHWLGLRPRRLVEVVIYSPAAFDAQYGGLFRFSAAGFYSGTIRIRGDSRVSESLVRVLHHELVHAAFDAALPSTSLPAWLNEGLAEWFEARALGKRHLNRGELDLLAAASRRGALSSLAELSGPSFSKLGSVEAHRAYVQSYAFIEDLVRRSGERALRELCLEVQRTGNLERSFKRAFRSDPAEAHRRFAASLQ